jgi:hypothetical protein
MYKHFSTENRITLTEPDKKILLELMQTYLQENDPKNRDLKNRDPKNRNARKLFEDLKAKADGEIQKKNKGVF